MRLTRLAFLCFLLLATSALMFADERPSTQLSSLNWMVGEWHATAKPPEGKAIEVVSRIEMSPTGEAINFTTMFNGVPHYNGFYAYDPAAKQIRFFYVSSEGELTTGTTVAQGDTLTQEFDIASNSGTKHLRSIIQRDGQDAYNWQVLGQKDGAWVQLIALRYTRSK